jgi:hypothetical protein
MQARFVALLAVVAVALVSVPPQAGASTPLDCAAQPGTDEVLCYVAPPLCLYKTAPEQWATCAHW